MWIEVLKFYRKCLARAFSGKFFLIEKWTGGVGLIAVLTSKFLPVPDRWQPIFENDLPLYFFLLVFGVIVLAGLITAPYTIYRDEREKRSFLEKAREPKLKVYVDSPSGSTENSGTTTETIGGFRQTTLRSVAVNGLSLVVENVGEERLNNRTAVLLAVECIEGEKQGAITIIEPIQLPWRPDCPEENLEATIEPGTKRRVWIANVNYRGWAWIFRDTNKLPADYQQLFGPSGKYRAVIQIGDGEALSVQTTIEFEAGEGEPRKNIPSGTGKASIAIVEQNSSPLSL